MYDAQLYGYALPFNTTPRDSGRVLRDTSLDKRQGLLVCLCRGGQRGWGEIAPLPGFSRETLAQACQLTRQWLDLWRAGSAPALPAMPSVAFGLSCALAELDHSLPAAANCHSVPLLNLAAVDHSPLAEATVAKCKVARADPRQEARQISQLLQQYPQLTLRLDANRGWTPEQARQFATGLPPHLLERLRFIEEPCQTVEQSAAFSRDTGLPLAWDESLRETASVVSLIRTPGTVALVIKPTLTGSLAQVRDQVALAQRHGCVAIISSSIESSLGLTQLARLADWLTPHTPPGLDTLSLLSAQLLRRWPGSSLPCLTTQHLERL